MRLAREVRQLFGFHANPTWVAVGGKTEVTGQSERWVSPFKRSTKRSTATDCHALPVGDLMPRSFNTLAMRRDDR